MATTAFNDLITFSRGSNATVVGSNGLIQWAPSNLLTFSEQFDNAAWTKNNGTVAANTTAAPDGTLTADKFVENTSNSSHFIIQSATTTATIHTFSVYAKAAGRTFVLLYHDQSNSGAVFNLSNGAITTPSGIPLAAASVTNAGNGWYRCAITVTATAASNGFRAQLGDTATNYVYTGDGVSGIFLWGAQLEIGSTATTYNPTTVKNLLGFSEAFDNAAWTKVAASIVTGAQANPVNGLFNAQKFMEDTTNAQHIVRVNIALPTITNTPYGYAVYAKAAGRTQIRLTDNNVSGATFTLTGAGATSNLSSGVTAAINQLADGWYRCFITVAAASVNGRLALNLVSSDNITYTGDGNSGVYIYGAQLSDSASLDPYVPTPGAAPSSTAYYGPRFDYDPVTLAPRGLLVEEARTNSLTYSADFANAAWTKSSCTVTANQGTAPDGTNTLTLLQFSAQFGRLQQGSLTSGTVYTFSIWCRVASGTRVYSLYDALGNPLGSFTATTTLTRYSVTFTAPATSTLYAVQDRNAGPFVDTFIWGAQLEAGTFATSYIPTIASTVTRSADNATITGSLFSQWYNQPEGAFIVEASTAVAPVAGSRVLEASAGTASRVVDLSVTSGPTLQMYNGTTAFNAAGTVTLNTPFKAAGAYRTANYGVVLNGGAVTANTDALLNTANALQIGRFNTASNYLNGHIRSIRYVPVRAADFQLQQVTT